MLGGEIGRTIGVTVGIGAVSLLAAKYALKPLYRAIRRRKHLWEEAAWGGERFLLFGMFLLWLGLIAGTGYAGTSPLFGAYLAGLVVAFISEEDDKPDHSIKLPSRFPRAPTIDLSNLGTTNLSRAITLPETTSMPPSTKPAPFLTAGTRDDTAEATPKVHLQTSFDGYIAQPLFRLLLPIFFGSIGYCIPFVPLWRGEVIWRGVIYAVLMILAKVGCGLWLFVWTKSWACWRGAVVLGLAMVARGEIGLL